MVTAVVLADLPAVTAGAIAAGAVTVGLGGLERYVRGKLRDKHKALSE